MMIEKDKKLLNKRFYIANAPTYTSAVLVPLSNMQIELVRIAAIKPPATLPDHTYKGLRWETEETSALRETASTGMIQAEK